MAQKKQMLSLPKPYLSPSQFMLWNSDPKRYIRQYVYGEKPISSRYTDFGTNVAELIEHDQFPIDVPRYTKMEHEMSAVIKTPEIRLFGRMDTFNPETLEFRDYKTGKRPWTPVMAYKSDQLLFYAVMIYRNYGMVPKTAWIDWIETDEAEDGSVRITGRVESLPCELDVDRVKLMEERIIKTAKEISQAYINELQKI